MRRTDGLLLAYLVARRRPAARPAVKQVLDRIVSGDGSAGAAAQLLIRSKAITPQEYVVLQQQVETARRRCERCGRTVIVFAGPRGRARRCACGHVTRVAATNPSERTRADPSSGHDRSDKHRAVPGHGPTPAAPVHEHDPTAATTLARLPRKIGKFPILEKLGDGGMGVVFKATDPDTQRTVALKLLKSDASRDATTRFKREVEAIARLRHPAIVQVHDVGEDERGRPFYTMDYIQGEELAHARKSMERARFLAVVATVADGLHHAHEQGVIHRDVKPQNILVDGKGEPHIADFGLARDLEQSSLTEVGDLVGTPLFMAPEQLRGDPNAIDRRTDVYALGVLLYEGLTGKLPIEATSLVELQRRITSVVPAAPSTVLVGLPRELDRLVLKALEKRPQDRYQTAAALADDLRRALSGEGVAARSVPLASAVRRVRRLTRWLQTPPGVLSLALLLVAVVIGVVVVRHQLEARRVEQQRLTDEQQRLRCSRAVVEAQEAAGKARGALGRGDVAEAATLARAAGKLATDAARLARDLGTVAPKDAIAQAEAAADDASRTEAAALARGGVAERAAARPLYEKLAERSPRDAGLRLALGQLELREGHVALALDHLTRARALAAERLDIRFAMAEAHRVAGRLAFAADDFSQCLADPARLAPIPVAWALAGRARCATGEGRFDAARGDLDKATREAPRDPRVLVARAELLAAEGQERAALELMEEARRESPKDAEVRLTCGRLWARAGDRVRALEELQAVVALDPTGEALALRARLQALEGDEAAADADLASALAATRPEDPARRQALLIQARLERARGEVDAAAAALTKALGSPGLDATARERVPLLLERAETLMGRATLEDVGTVERDLRAVLELSPDDARAMRVQARVAMRRREHDTARSLCSLRLATRKDDAEAQVLMGRALRALDDPAAAAAEASAAATQAALLVDEPKVGLEVGPPLDEALLLLAQGRRALDRALAAEGALRRSVRERFLAQARPRLERALALAPWLAQARVALAQARLQGGAADQALAELDADPDGGTEAGQALRGQLLAAGGKHPDAVDAWGRALRLLDADEKTPARDQREARLRLGRATSLSALGRVSEALADLDLATRLAPKLGDAFELRGTLRRSHGDPEGAAKDEARVDLLRAGWKAVYNAAVTRCHELWQAGQGHDLAAAALAPAFDCIAADRSTEKTEALAELHARRAFMLIREFDLDDALIDLAAMVELSPRTFPRMFEEFVTFDQSLQLDVGRVLDETRARVATQVEVDPDFLRAYLVFIEVEFRRPGPDPAAIRRGLRFLGGYLDRKPSSQAGLLLRAVLLLAARELDAARAVVNTVLEDPGAPSFAHLVLARVLAARQDRDGALAAFGRALDGEFTSYQALLRDPWLATIRGDKRWDRLVALSQGKGYLAQMDRLEVIRRDRPDEDPLKLWTQGVSSATQGVEFLLGLIAEGDLEARALAARLWLARGRDNWRLGMKAEAARDVVAALEASPRAALEWNQLVEALDALATVPAELLRDARANGKEPFPKRLGLAAPALLDALRGKADADALAKAESALANVDAADPLSVWAAVLRLGRAQTAPSSAAAWADQTLERAKSALGLAELATVRDWLTARVHATKGQTEPALEALGRAVAGGLRGPLARDPAFRSIQSHARFGELSRKALEGPQWRWRER